MKLRLCLAAVVMMGLLMTAAGCGDKKVKITGKLMKDGQPFTTSADTLVTLTFAPDVEKSEQTYNGRFNHETGGYEVELPPGKYRARYVIVKKGAPPLIVSPEATKTVHDLSTTKELNIEIAGK
jgi:hypothetical protein